MTFAKWTVNFFGLKLTENREKCNAKKCTTNNPPSNHIITKLVWALQKPNFLSKNQTKVETKINKKTEGLP